MGDCSKDTEHQFAAGRGRIDAFLEADEVDVVRLEVLDRFEQFLEGASKNDSLADITGVSDSAAP